jgi:hypothetical protein
MDIKTYRRNYRIKNRDRIKRQRKEHYEANHVALLSFAKKNAAARYQKNRELILEHNRNYFKSKRGKFLRYKSCAEKRNISWNLTEEEFESFWQKSCHYCGDSISTVGIDRRDNSRGYSLGNIVSCCWSCNKMKGILSHDEYLSRCKQVHLFTK